MSRKARRAFASAIHRLAPFCPRARSPCTRRSDARKQQSNKKATPKTQEARGKNPMQKSAVSGAMMLLTEYDESGAQEVRSLRLEPAADGKAVLLIEIDERKPGIHREVRYEITPAELIAAIRAHGAELPGEQHNR
jgi:Mrp family chromosome partitioning ATPase